MQRVENIGIMRGLLGDFHPANLADDVEIRYYTLTIPLNSKPEMEEIDVSISDRS